MLFRRNTKQPRFSKRSLCETARTFRRLKFWQVPLEQTSCNAPNARVAVPQADDRFSICIKLILFWQLCALLHAHAVDIVCAHWGSVIECWKKYWSSFSTKAVSCQSRTELPTRCTTAGSHKFAVDVLSSTLPGDDVYQDVETTPAAYTYSHFAVIFETM